MKIFMYVNDYFSRVNTDYVTVQVRRQWVNFILINTAKMTSSLCLHMDQNMYFTKSLAYVINLKKNK